MKLLLCFLVMAIQMNITATAQNAECPAHPIDEGFRNNLLTTDPSGLGFKSYWKRALFREKLAYLAVL